MSTNSKTLKADSASGVGSDLLSATAKTIRLVIRGCGHLPHLGEHPGTQLLLAFLALGGIAGAKGGAWGILGGFAVMAIFMVPLYCVGAYLRAVESDALVAQEQETL